MQFSLSGGRESTGGLFAATEDENTLMISKDFDQFVTLKERIEQLMITSRQPQPVQPVAAASSASVADELVKLANLRDSGVLSKGEFEAQKKRLLG